MKKPKCMAQGLCVHEGKENKQTKNVKMLKDFQFIQVEVYGNSYYSLWSKFLHALWYNKNIKSKNTEINIHNTLEIFVIIVYT